MSLGFIESVRTRFDGYIEELPANWERETVKGFAVGFILGTAVTVNPAAGLFCGALSAIATLVHAAVTPLFKYINDSSRDLDFVEEIVRGSFSFVVAASVAATGGMPLVSSVGLMALFHGVRVFFNDSVRSTTKATWLAV